MAKKSETEKLVEVKQGIEPVEINHESYADSLDDVVADIEPSYTVIDDEDFNEEEKIKKYEEFLVKYKIDLEREADTAETSFHFAGNEVLLELARTYSDIPYSYNPKVADILYKELTNRGLTADAEKLKESLNKCYWYTKPWLRF